MRYVIAFDVDETLEFAAGPIPVDAIRKLYAAGHIVGLCGNWAKFVNTIPDWNSFISFIGQVKTSKTVFLTELKAFIKADDYIMIGNDPSHYGNSNDIQAAAEAGWRFIREDQFDINQLLG